MDSALTVIPLVGLVFVLGTLTVRVAKAWGKTRSPVDDGIAAPATQVSSESPPVLRKLQSIQDGNASSPLVNKQVSAGNGQPPHDGRSILERVVSWPGSQYAAHPMRSVVLAASGILLGFWLIPYVIGLYLIFILVAPLLLGRSRDQSDEQVGFALLFALLIVGGLSWYTSAAVSPMFAAVSDLGDRNPDKTVEPPPKPLGSGVAPLEIGAATMPDLVSFSTEYSKKELATITSDIRVLDLSPRSRDVALEEDADQPWRVVAQEPESGTTLLNGSSVVLWALRTEEADWFASHREMPTVAIGVATDDAIGESSTAWRSSLNTVGRRVTPPLEQPRTLTCSTSNSAA